MNPFDFNISDEEATNNIENEQLVDSHQHDFDSTKGLFT